MGGLPAKAPASGPGATPRAKVLPVTKKLMKTLGGMQALTRRRTDGRTGSRAASDEGQPGAQLGTSSGPAAVGLGSHFCTEWDDSETFRWIVGVGKRGHRASGFRPVASWSPWPKRGALQ